MGGGAPLRRGRAGAAITAALLLAACAAAPPVPAGRGASTPAPGPAAGVTFVLQTGEGPWLPPVFAAASTADGSALADIAALLQAAAPAAGIPEFPSCGAASLTVVALPGSVSWVVGRADGTADRIAPDVLPCGPGGASGTAATDPGYATVDGRAMRVPGLLTALRALTGREAQVQALQVSPTVYAPGEAVRLSGAGWVGPVQLSLSWCPQSSSGACGPQPVLPVATVATAAGALQWSGTWPAGVPAGATLLRLTVEGPYQAVNVALQGP